VLGGVEEGRHTNGSNLDAVILERSAPPSFVILSDERSEESKSLPRAQCPPHLSS